MAVAVGLGCKHPCQAMQLDCQQDRLPLAPSAAASRWLAVTLHPRLWRGMIGEQSHGTALEEVVEVSELAWDQD